MEERRGLLPREITIPVADGGNVEESIILGDGRLKAVSAYTNSATTGPIYVHLHVGLRGNNVILAEGWIRGSGVGAHRLGQLTWTGDIPVVSEKEEDVGIGVQNNTGVAAVIKVVVIVE